MSKGIGKFRPHLYPYLRRLEQSPALQRQMNQLFLQVLNKLVKLSVSLPNEKQQEKELQVRKAMKQIMENNPQCAINSEEFVNWVVESLNSMTLVTEP